MPELIKPMLATAGALPPARAEDEWAFEMKWDGVRAVVYAEGDALVAMSRNDRDITVSYPELASVGAALTGIDAVLDGELVALDPETGRPSFGTLQHRMHVADAATASRLATRIPVTYVVFDLLRLSGQSLVRVPYHDRRELLEHLDLAGPSHLTTPVFSGPGRDVLQASRDQGMEGIIAKRRESLYEPGRRSTSWLKIKHVRDQEVVIGGWRPGAGRRAGAIGSLMMGIPAEHGLRYVGQVGTGFSDAALTSLGRTLAGIVRPTSPFTVALPNAVAADAHWVDPSLVGEVVYSEWTGDGVLRHPAWRGLRPDKSPADVMIVDGT